MSLPRLAETIISCKSKLSTVVITKTEINYVCIFNQIIITR